MKKMLFFGLFITAKACSAAQVPAAAAAKSASSSENKAAPDTKITISAEQEKLFQEARKKRAEAEQAKNKSLNLNK